MEAKKNPKSRNSEEEESSEKKPLTLEDYMMNPDDEIGKFLPRENEERVISGAVNKVKELERKKNQKVGEKLVVEKGKSGGEIRYEEKYGEKYEEKYEDSESLDEVNELQELLEESFEDEVEEKGWKKGNELVLDEEEKKKKVGKGNSKVQEIEKEKKKEKTEKITQRADLSKRNEISARKEKKEKSSDYQESSEEDNYTPTIRIEALKSRESKERDEIATKISLDSEKGKDKEKVKKNIYLGSAKERDLIGSRSSKSSEKRVKVAEKSPKVIEKNIKNAENTKNIKKVEKDEEYQSDQSESEEIPLKEATKNKTSGNSKNKEKEKAKIVSEKDKEKEINREKITSPIPKKVDEKKIQEKKAQEKKVENMKPLSRPRSKIDEKNSKPIEDEEYHSEDSYEKSPLFQPNNSNSIKIEEKKNTPKPEEKPVQTLEKTSAKAKPLPQKQPAKLLKNKSSDESSSSKDSPKSPNSSIPKTPIPQNKNSENRKGPVEKEFSESKKVPTRLSPTPEITKEPKEEFRFQLKSRSSRNSSRNSHHRENTVPVPLPEKKIEQKSELVQTDPTNIEKSYIEKIAHCEKIIKSQSNELEKMRNKLSQKAAETQSFRGESEKVQKKLEKLKKQLLKANEEIKRISEISESKEYAIAELKNKIDTVTGKSVEIQHKKSLISESEFWKLEENDDRGRGEISSLRDIAKNKSLWITHMEEKKYPLEVSEKSRVPESAHISKNFDFSKKVSLKSKNKSIRRSLEPLTPMARHKPLP